ncbi:MAG: hypothetical protein NZZ41_00155 [Candidatus Dojkabacteria bacterium]|nr:hypothetical protein [Candidatus Dojkabacteria bacterium]
MYYRTDNFSFFNNIKEETRYSYDVLEKTKKDQYLSPLIISSRFPLHGDFFDKFFSVEKYFIERNYIDNKINVFNEELVVYLNMGLINFLSGVIFDERGHILVITDSILNHDFFYVVYDKSVFIYKKVYQSKNLGFSILAPLYYNIRFDDYYDLNVDKKDIGNTKENSNKTKKYHLFTSHPIFDSSMKFDVKIFDEFFIYDVVPIRLAIVYSDNISVHPGTPIFDENNKIVSMIYARYFKNVYFIIDHAYIEVFYNILSKNMETDYIKTMDDNILSLKNNLRKKFLILNDSILVNSGLYVKEDFSIKFFNFVFDLKKEDVITKINNRKISSISELYYEIITNYFSNEINILIFRNNQLINIDLKKI